MRKVKMEHENMFKKCKNDDKMCRYKTKDNMVEL